MKFEFLKMHGCGNDFILVNNYENKSYDWSPDFVNMLCNRHIGIGADGFIVLEKDKESSFFMRFFNSDGYESDMCANGSRCICKFAYDLDFVKNEFIFRANDGFHKSYILNKNIVKVQVNLIRSYNEIDFTNNITLPDDIHYRGFLNTGVPHLILECDKLEDVDVYKIGKELRYHKLFKPAGTNVNFVEALDGSSELKIRTYERGVEQETLSCGSGVTASAIIFAQMTKQNNANYNIITSGGKLTVELSNEFNSIFLQGPAVNVYKGIYSKEGLQ